MQNQISKKMMGDSRSNKRSKTKTNSRKTPATSSRGLMPNASTPGTHRTRAVVLASKKGNPRKRILCGQDIRDGHAWARDASAEDPDSFGRNVTIRHSSHCSHQGKREAFQAQLARAA